MTRRDLLKRLGLGAAAISLSPLLDLADIVTAPEAIAIDAVEYDQLLAVAQIKWLVNMKVHNPRRMKMITSIC